MKYFALPSALLATCSIACGQFLCNTYADGWVANVTLPVPPLIVDGGFNCTLRIPGICHPLGQEYDDPCIFEWTLFVRITSPGPANPTPPWSGPPVQICFGPGNCIPTSIPITSGPNPLVQEVFLDEQFSFFCGNGFAATMWVAWPNWIQIAEVSLKCYNCL